MVHLINHCELRLVAKFSRGRNIFWGYLSTTYLYWQKFIWTWNWQSDAGRCGTHHQRTSKIYFQIFLKTFLHKFLILLIEYRFKLAQLNNFKFFFQKLFDPVLPGSQACCKVYAPIWSSPLTQIMLTMIHFMRV